MSHFKERREKNCLNCGIEVAGRYCQHCGQENVETKESFWHLVQHFFNDITHYDGKFFDTVKFLLLKPGFLTAEYYKGRRASYLNPIRMYVFTSAFFFLIFFTFFSSSEKKDKVMELREIIAAKQMTYRNLVDMEKNARDTEMKSIVSRLVVQYNMDIQGLSDSLQRMENAKPVLKNKSIVIDDHNVIGLSADSAKKELSKDFLDFEFYKDVASYRAVQHELPKDKRDGLLTRAVKEEVLRFHEKLEKEGGKIGEKFQDKFSHSFPTLLFVSLPLFAWMLKLIYYRRKQFYYADHGIFAIHTYCAMFLLLLLYYTLSALGGVAGWLASILSFALSIYMIYYGYKAMRVFYQQSRLKTIAKYFLLLLLSMFLMIFLMMIFLIISAYRV